MEDTRSKGKNEAYNAMIVNMTVASTKNCNSSYSGTRPVKTFVQRNIFFGLRPAFWASSAAVINPKITACIIISAPEDGFNTNSTARREVNSHNAAPLITLWIRKGMTNRTKEPKT